MRYNNILIASLIALLIIVIIIVPYRINDYELFLSGFWTGDSKFLEESGLSDMFIYISPRDDNTREGYLVMIDTDGNIITNQNIKINYGSLFGRSLSALNGHFITSDENIYNINSAEFIYDNKNIMPETMNIGVNITNGTLALYDDEELYAFFTKDNEASMIANKEFLFKHYEE